MTFSKMTFNNCYSFGSLLIFMIVLPKILTIWPPPYEIKLTDGETFVISEFLETDDLLSDEDEMIKPFKTADPEKFLRIHQMALRRNKKELEEKKDYLRNINKIKEHNFDLDDAVPWEGGFVDKNGNFIQPDNENVYYLNEMAKSLIDNKIEMKREEVKENTVEDKEENYDYNSFKSEYAEQIKKVERQNDTFNFTEVKEDESLNDAIETIIDFKDAKNCSIEENKGIGLKAFKCIVNDMKTPKDKKSTIRLVGIIFKIILVWFFVYVIIAIPCWCQRGWCCCCCCCKICRPRQLLDEAKEFYMNNPIGVYHNDMNEKIEYQPTEYEISVQKRLERALFNL